MRHLKSIYYMFYKFEEKEYLMISNYKLEQTNNINIL